MLAFEPACRTTAMGIMPHRDVDRAIDLALSLDVPFWPQLPNVSYFEDMYAQASEHFPGITVAPDRQALGFDGDRFATELLTYAEVCDRPETFSLTPRYSLTYQRFIARDLSRFAAVRGQVIGPVSFGFRVVDGDRRPIIYDDEVRPLLFEFIQQKVNRQYEELRARHPAAFVWLDEPGLGWVFSAMAGYSDTATREDYATFLAGISGPKALHLCADVNLPFLCQLDLDVLSCDVYQIGRMPAEYARAAGEFLARGGTISWGVVPTDSLNRAGETAETLAERLIGIWRKINVQCGIDLKQIAAQSLIAPARCCLKNVGKVGAMDDSRPAAGDRNADAAGSVEESLVAAAFGDLAIVAALAADAV